MKMLTGLEPAHEVIMPRLQYFYTACSNLPQFSFAVDSSSVSENSQSTTLFYSSFRLYIPFSNYSSLFTPFIAFAL